MSTPVSQIMQSMALLPTHADPSDGELLERFIDQKDDTAFTLLMNRHGRMVYGIARRLLKNPADADDVCQATFLVLARKAAQLERQRSIADWLVGVVRKLAADVRKLVRWYLNQIWRCESSQAYVLRPGVSCNCVVVRRGGEQQDDEGAVRNGSEHDSASRGGEPAS